MRAIVPEDITDTTHRRSLVRAITAHALGTLRHTTPTSVLSRAWPRDEMAERALQTLTRGAVVPTMSGNTPALGVQAVRMLWRLAPKSAALQLFAEVMNVELSGGIATVRIPNVASVPAAKFIVEGEPGPLVQFNTLSGAVLGPVRKLTILSAVTAELERANPESAAEIIGRLLAASVERGIDVVAFGTAAGDAAQPAGLLNAVVPLTATAGGGSAAMVGDITKLATALAAARLDASTMVLIAAPGQATTLALLAGPQFNYRIYSTSALPAGTIMAVVPDAIAVAVEGAPAVETSKHVALHFEDTAPQQISAAGVPNTAAAPVRSAFQHDVVAIRCTARLVWVVAAPGGVQVINGVTW